MKNNKEPKGLGGWLLLPIIGLFISIPLSVIALINLYSILNLTLYFIFLFCLELFLMLWAMYLLYLISEKRKTVIKLICCYYITLIVIAFAIAFIYNDYSNITFYILGSIIWFHYFTKSKRVKNTFIN